MSAIAGALLLLAGGLCLTPDPSPPLSAPADTVGPRGSDCSITSSNPTPAYDPTVDYVVQVVVHVIMDAACSQGAITDEQVASQIAVLNEDFGALAGSPGENGVDSGIRFVLATEDPAGDPTTGITRDCNATWFADQGSYWTTLAWDPTRYLNLYTNTAANARGYVPFLPADPGAGVGTAADRVVINHLAFGRPGPVPAHALGRTSTHEVGHYMGLFHPYFNGCGVATAPDCYTTGDTLCDTAPDAAAHDVCPVGATSCGGFTAPIDNYMELTDDGCLERFTLEQARRMRCTLETYRPAVFTVDALFEDGFESGDTAGWSGAVP